MSPSSPWGAAIELHYWDRHRKVRLRLQLRRFEVCLLLVLGVTLLVSLFGHRVRLSDYQFIISLARTFLG